MAPAVGSPANYCHKTTAVGMLPPELDEEYPIIKPGKLPDAKWLNKYLGEGKEPALRRYHLPVPRT